MPGKKAWLKHKEIIMGRKSKVNPDDQEELIRLIHLGELTQLQIANEFRKRGIHMTERIVNRYAARTNKQVVKLASMGVPEKIARNHKADFQELAYLLLKREIIGQTNQDNEKEIMAIKERIEFFTGKVES